MIEQKFIKHCEIGELVFDIGITRAMAVKGFEKYPNYWDAITKSNAIKNQTDKQNLLATDSKSLVELVELADVTEKETENIVTYLLPSMLEYAESPLPENVDNYFDYALMIIKYCLENNVLRKHIDEETNTVVQGFYSYVFKFISEGFTYGGKLEKSAVKIMMN